jgi:DHA3 family macrolide efflux protein-like MFS transporter
MEQIANNTTFKSYIIFWVGQLFSMLGSSVVVFVITFWIADVYGDPVISAFAYFLHVLIMTIVMPIAGVITDRINRKHLIILVDSLQAVATLMLILFFQFGITNFWVIYMFISIRAFFQAFHVPAVNAIVPMMVPKEKLSRVNGISYLFSGVLQILSPFLAAVLLIIFSPHMIFWIDIITFFIALVPLVMISVPSIPRVNHSKKAVEKNPFIQDFKLGLKTLKIIPGLIIVMLLAMILNFLITPAQSLLVLFIIQVHNGTSGHIALVQMIFTGGMILGAIFTSLKKNWNRKIRVIFITITTAMVGYLILSIAPSGSYLILGLGGVVLGFNLPIANSLYLTFVQSSVPLDKQGRVTSITHTLVSVINPIGTLISGPLALFLGMPVLFFFCSLIGIFVVISFWSFTGIRKVNIDSEKEFKRINGEIEELNV